MKEDLGHDGPLHFLHPYVFSNLLHHSPVQVQRGLARVAKEDSIEVSQGPLKMSSQLPSSIQVPRVDEQKGSTAKPYRVFLAFARKTRISQPSNREPPCSTDTCPKEKGRVASALGPASNAALVSPAGPGVLHKLEPFHMPPQG